MLTAVSKEKAAAESTYRLRSAVPKFFYSRAMLYILALLLVLVFFLPDLIGPLPAILCGVAVIGFAFFVYNLWCKSDRKEEQTPRPGGVEDDLP